VLKGFEEQLLYCWGIPVFPPQEINSITVTVDGTVQIFPLTFDQNLILLSLIDLG